MDKNAESTINEIEESFIYRRGTKYYQVTNNSVKIIRIVNIKNINSIVCVLDEFYHGAESIKPENTFTLTPDELSKNYKLLLPAGQICLVDVKSNMYNVFDVLLAATKIETTPAVSNNVKFGDIEVICRQAILDFFGLVINPNEQTFGISVSRKTCPSNIRFNDLYTDCEPIDKGQFINIYQQDTIDQILGLLKTTKSDQILKNIYDEFNDEEKRPKGVVKSLSELVKTNAFINDIQSMFDIIPMPDVTIKYEDNNYILKDVDAYRIEYAIKCQMKDILIMEYNHFIEEDSLSEDYKHIKICDSTNTVYIIQFTPVAGFAEELYPDSVKEDMRTLLNKYNNDI